VVQRDGVQRGVDPAAREQPRQGGAEAQRAADLGEVQRLDAEAVAGEDEPAGPPLDEGEGEHAQEAVDAAVAPLGVGLRDDLRVARGEEAVAEALELRAQLVVVVDAAVEDDGAAGRRIDERLGARVGEVDDLQAAMTERDRPGRPRAGAIGAAPRHGRRHALDGGDVGAVARAMLSGETAHGGPRYPPSKPPFVA
jgi:hypothetical protein